MKILVCIKQVPDLEQLAVEAGAEGAAVIGAVTEFRMNRFDEFSVEAAVQVKETQPKVRIDALTVGPPRASAVIKRAVGMGADRCVHLLTRDAGDPNPAAVSAWIGLFARFKSYSLILTGAMSEDGMNGQVGPAAAAHMNLPCATQVIHMQPSNDGSAVYVEREIEGGAREMLQISLPAVLALQPGINRPRYPSLSNLLRAGRLGVETIDVDSFQGPEPSVAPLGSVLPTRIRTVEMLTGSATEKADRFLAILRSKAFIR